jgi:hypothetical protein
MVPLVPMLHRQVRALVFSDVDDDMSSSTSENVVPRCNTGPGASGRSVGVTISDDDGFIHTVDGHAFTPFRQIRVRDDRDTCDLLLCEKVTGNGPVSPIAQIQFSLGDSTHTVTCTTPLMIVRFGAGMILPLDGIGMFSRDRDPQTGGLINPASRTKADVDLRHSVPSPCAPGADDDASHPADAGRSHKRRRLSATASGRRKECPVSEYDAISSTNGRSVDDASDIHSARGGRECDAVDIDEFHYDTSDNGGDDDDDDDDDDEFDGNDDEDGDEDDEEFVDGVGGCDDDEIDENDDAYDTMSVSSTTDFF